MRLNSQHTNLFLHAMPKALFQKYKAWCILRDTTVKEHLAELVRKCIKDPLDFERTTYKPIDPEEIVCVVNIHNFSRTLRNHFKAWCELRNISMTEKVIHMIRETIKGA